MEAVCRTEAEGGTTVRLHTGDPSLFGAIREQTDALTRKGIAWDVTPGVSSFCGAAAALGAEFPWISLLIMLAWGVLFFIVARHGLRQSD